MREIGLSANLCTGSDMRELIEQGFEVAVVEAVELDLASELARHRVAATPIPTRHVGSRWDGFGSRQLTTLGNASTRKSTNARTEGSRLLSGGISNETCAFCVIHSGSTRTSDPAATSSRTT